MPHSREGEPLPAPPLLLPSHFIEAFCWGLLGACFSTWMKQLFPLKRDGLVTAALLGRLTPDAPARDCGVPFSAGEWGQPGGELAGGEEPKARGSSREGGCKESRSSRRAAPLRFASAGSAEAGSGTVPAFKPALEQSSWEGAALGLRGAEVCQDRGFRWALGKDPQQGQCWRFCLC